MSEEIEKMSDVVQCCLCKKTQAVLMLVPWAERFDNEEWAEQMFHDSLPVCKDCDGAGVVRLFEHGAKFEKVIVSDLDGRRISCKPRKIVDRKEVSPWRIRQKLAISAGDSGFRVHPNYEGKFRNDPRHTLKGK